MKERVSDHIRETETTDTRRDAHIQRGRKYTTQTTQRGYLFNQHASTLDFRIENHIFQCPHVFHGIRAELWLTSRAEKKVRTYFKAGSVNQMPPREDSSFSVTEHRSLRGPVHQSRPLSSAIREADGLSLAGEDDCTSLLPPDTIIRSSIKHTEVLFVPGRLYILHLSRFSPPAATSIDDIDCFSVKSGVHRN